MITASQHGINMQSSGGASAIIKFYDTSKTMVMIKEANNYVWDKASVEELIDALLHIRETMK
jgi:hypothetical protein